MLAQEVIDYDQGYGGMLEGVERIGHELSLSFRPIQEIPAVLASREGPHVKTLNLTECELSSFKNLHQFPMLETLILDKNGLEGLEGCPVMETVTTLWFNNNNVSDLPVFMDNLMQCFPRLAYLSMMRNPACPGLMDLITPDLEACRLYRLYVLYRAPQLRALDSTEVTQQELQEAKLRGQFAVKRRPASSVGRTASSTSTPSQMSYSTLPGSTPPVPTRQSSSFLGYQQKRYDGKNSEGNRFISDRDL
mmetsp:Transcript_23610/g.34333  ORF Transcript_23610/g.34333 Transcript_23610/m.34333 type:complete len:249 (-) Transcript_23610:99-845(-)|eukprot:CAMPEP_0113933824 /NCGR_PEP_ID=MMETSP1339-20121228/1141_1 /TAXON_ID=94617 /ORGANISM="Fibrocapsa japonica" /LENGTH=248 /DNA_ID=CAMNT_0000935307 /DNA_START=162 /DNA_END=908 /DNA_ORIENTATION=+ /assembly_acc=CAM_ASM_000762